MTAGSCTARRITAGSCTARQISAGSCTARQSSAGSACRSSRSVSGHVLQSRSVPGHVVQSRSVPGHVLQSRSVPGHVLRVSPGQWRRQCMARVQHAGLHHNNAKPQWSRLYSAALWTMPSRRNAISTSQWLILVSTILYKFFYL